MSGPITMRGDARTSDDAAFAVSGSVGEARGQLDRLLGLRGTPASNRHPWDMPQFLVRDDDWHVFATPRTTRPGEPLGAPFATPSGLQLSIVCGDDGRVDVPFDLDEAYHNYVSEAWVATSTNRRLSSGMLALYYSVKRAVPRGLQLKARRALIRRQQAVVFPAWPLERGVERLVALRLLAAMGCNRAGADMPFRWFWPDGLRAALILSHDVETHAGQRLAIEIADLEESHGFRSAFNFGAWYDADPGVLRELDGRGFEIGMHGLIHDRALFSSREAFEAQLPGLRALAGKLGAVGFRSPATHRVWDWLGELPVEYDGTLPHSDPYEPQPGGCSSLWPFFIGDVVELPYTLPQDHTLLTLLGRRTADYWIDVARSIEERFGLIHCVSHPDRGYLADPGKRAVYGAFLAAMAERRAVWHALPRDAARWWRERDSLELSRVGHGKARLDDSGLEAILMPPQPTDPNPES